MELVVDANILVSCLLKDGITRKLMLNNTLKLYTSEFIFIEFFNHLKEIAKKAGIKEKEMTKLTKKLIKKSNLTIITKDQIKEFTGLADKISPDIDDTLYFATALKLKCPIWSNDKELKNQKYVKIYSTSEIIKIINLKDN